MWRRKLGIHGGFERCLTICLKETVGEQSAVSVMLWQWRLRETCRGTIELSGMLDAFNLTYGSPNNSSSSQVGSDLTAQDATNGLMAAEGYASVWLTTGRHGNILLIASISNWLADIPFHALAVARIGLT